MKPGNRGQAAVPIPAGENLTDEVAFLLGLFCMKRLYYNVGGRT